MSFELIVTSLVGLCSGVISLYTDPRDKKHRIWQLVLLGLLILSAGCTIFFGYQKEQESRTNEEESKATIRQLNNELSQVKKKLDDLPKQILVLLGLGWSQENLRNPNQSDISQSLQASQLLQTVSGNTSQRKAITVQYFPKDVDPNIVKTRLENLGFTLVTGSPRSNLPTNSIWFGSEVDLNSVKAVAYTLIGAGVPLKAIRQFNDDNGRERFIQVGGDPDCLDRPALTAEQIKNMAKFPQQRAVVNCRMVF
jgi:hypothetical protein